MVLAHRPSSTKRPEPENCPSPLLARLPGPADAAARLGRVRPPQRRRRARARLPDGSPSALSVNRALGGGLHNDAARDTAIDDGVDVTIDDATEVDR